MGDFSGGGMKKSQSSKVATTTTNNNLDRRQVIGEGGFGFAADGASISVTNQTLDSGALQGALNTANTAIEAISAADATNGQGFSQLLNLADRLFTGGGAILSQTADATLGAVAALNTAQNDSTGKIDQKTIMVAVGVAGAVAIAFAMSKGK